MPPLQKKEGKNKLCVFLSGHFRTEELGKNCNWEFANIGVADGELWQRHSALWAAGVEIDRDFLRWMIPWAAEVSYRCVGRHSSIWLSLHYIKLDVRVCIAARDWNFPIPDSERHFQQLHCAAALPAWAVSSGEWCHLSPARRAAELCLGAGRSGCRMGSSQLRLSSQGAQCLQLLLCKESRGTLSGSRLSWSQLLQWGSGGCVVGCCTPVTVGTPGRMLRYPWGAGGLVGMMDRSNLQTLTSHLGSRGPWCTSPFPESHGVNPQQETAMEYCGSATSSLLSTCSPSTGKKWMGCRRQ